MTTINTTNDLTRAILLEIPKHFPARCWRRNVGGGYPVHVVQKAIALLESGNIPQTLAFLRHQRLVTFGLPGEADIDGIIGVAGHGLRLGIEVKRGPDRIREDQERYGAMLRKYGGIWLVAHSVEEAVEGVRGAVGG